MFDVKLLIYIYIYIILNSQYVCLNHVSSMLFLDSFAEALRSAMVVSCPDSFLHTQLSQRCSKDPTKGPFCNCSISL